MYKPYRGTFLKPIILRHINETQKVFTTQKGDNLDRSKAVSASEVGKCARAIKFGKLANVSGSPIEGKLVTPPGSNGYAVRGDAVEAWVAEAIDAYNVGQFTHYGDNQLSLMIEPQSGTPDLFHWEHDYLDVGDIKSIDPRANKTKLPKPEHVKQVIQNCDLAQEYWQDVTVRHGILSYVDASNFELVDEFFIDFQDAVVNEIADSLYDRAKWIMETDDPYELPPEGVYVGECKTCNFAPICNGVKIATEAEKERQNGYGQTASKFFG